jgi:hypothetical protein
MYFDEILIDMKWDQKKISTYHWWLKYQNKTSFPLSLWESQKMKETQRENTIPKSGHHFDFWNKVVFHFLDLDIWTNTLWIWIEITILSFFWHTFVIFWVFDNNLTATSHFLHTNLWTVPNAPAPKWHRFILAIILFHIQAYQFVVWE